jgi:hypothetical protein
MRIALLAVTAAAVWSGTAAAQETVENPEYKNWSQFKKGASVTLKMTATASGMTIETLVTTTLVEVGTKLKLEMTSITKAGGMEIKSPPFAREVEKTLTLPPGAKAEDVKAQKPEGRFAEGSETVKVAGTEFKTKWYQSKIEAQGLKTETKQWMCDDIPGGMVKMEATTTGAAGSTMKMEVVEFKKP